MRKSCETCYYECKSKEGAVCSYYFTIDEGIEREMDDERIDEIIEAERHDFYEQWFQYIEEYE